MNRREFIELAIEKGLPKERIREAMDARRKRLGAFDDDPQPASQDVAQPPAPPQEEESWASQAARALAPLSMAASEAPQPAPREINTSQRPTSFADFSTTRQDPSVGIAPALDAISLPDRALAKTRGMEMSDPSAFLLRPEADETRANVQAINEANPWEGQKPTSFADFGQNAAPGVGELLLQTASSPGSIAAAVPKKVIGAVNAAIRPTSALKDAAPLIERGAERIQQTVLRPRVGDWRSGFDIKNIEKYGVQGSVDEVLAKSQSQIDEAANQLRTLIEQGKDKGTRLNLYNVIDKAEAEIKKTGSPDLVSKIKPIMKEFRQWAKVESSREGVNRIGGVDLLQAQKFKQMMGGYGDWESAADASKALISKDERFQSRAAKAVYDVLRKEIENAGPDGIKELNRKLSDLIPIRASAANRKIVSDRNDPISLKDMISSAAAIGSGPTGAGMLAATKFTTTGAGAKSLYWLSERLKKAKTPIEASFYEQKLQDIGVTAAALNVLRSGEVMNEQDYPRSSKIAKALDKTHDEERKAALMAILYQNIEQEMAKRQAPKQEE